MTQEIFQVIFMMAWLADTHTFIHGNGAGYQVSADNTIPLVYLYIS